MCYLQITLILFAQINPCPIADVDFSRPKRVQKEKPTTPIKSSAILPPTATEVNEFFSDLRRIMPASGILTAVDLQEQTRDNRSRTVKRLPPLMSSLYDSKYRTYTEHSLSEECKRVIENGVIDTRESEARYLEEQTRLQSECQLWFDHRKGRITASKFGNVKKAKLVNPAASLAREITQRKRFDSSKIPAIQWGIENEAVAREEYLRENRECHQDLVFRPAGLYIHKDYSYLAASPDGVVEGRCCGEGLLEIKCPFTHRYANPKEIADPTFCLSTSDINQLHLSRDHNYFHQVQGQLNVCDKDYCDFIIWTTQGIYVERIVRDREFFESIKPALEKFFQFAVLPRILCGSDSTDSEVPTKHTRPSDTKLYCKCKQPESGRMIACDNELCEGQWFHYACAGIKRKPQG